MKVKLGEVLSKSSTFQHVYDFGTSTELKLRVADERQGRIGSEPLRLLSLNEEMLLPVVNSPRMGMCGYEGPE